MEYFIGHDAMTHWHSTFAFFGAVTAGLVMLTGLLAAGNMLLVFIWQKLRWGWHWFDDWSGFWDWRQRQKSRGARDQICYRDIPYVLHEVHLNEIIDACHRRIAEIKHFREDEARKAAIQFEKDVAAGRRCPRPESKP